MVAIPAIPRWTVPAYLDLERFSTVKHEYVDGYVYALAGGTQAHNAICANIVTLLRSAARGGPCRVYTSDMKVKAADEVYLYPDVSVSCDPDDRRDDRDWIAAPRLAVEVLSDSTAAYDRTDKFTLIARNAALVEYLLVDARRPAVEVRSRQPDGTWTIATHGPGESVTLAALAASVSVAAIYEDVSLPVA
jgi:Uma2 family endonuclease